MAVGDIADDRCVARPLRAAAWLHPVAWAAVVLVTLSAAILPDLLKLPSPTDDIVLNRGIYLPGNDGPGEVKMPLSIYARFTNTPPAVRVLFNFDLASVSDEDLYVFIPSFNRRIKLAANGSEFFDSEPQSFWSGAFISMASLVRIPRAIVATGPNTLTLDILDVGAFAVPVYVSELYIGGADTLSWPFKLRYFFQDQLKIMALAAHLLLGIGMVIAYFFRPKDPLFGWLAAFIVLNLLFAIGMLVGWQPSVRGFIVFFAMLAPAMGLLFVAFSLALVGVPPPKMLAYISIGVTGALLPCLFVDSMISRIIVGAGGAVVVIVALIIGAGIVAWSAIRRGDADAQLVLPSAVLLAWFALRDVYITATLPAHGFNLLTPYARPVYLSFLTAVLLRRIGVALDQLDRSNENLSLRLAEREAQLAAFHRQEKVKTAHLVREQERQRLTHDLHDGISGHLASIIALSERTGDKSTEQAAREALNDLRLVIYSLDLDDSELPVALANFRDRLIPQLQRLGIELDWSIAGLPDVSGVTPGNALAILRILQEAVTNAVKHGSARRIVIRASAAADGKVMITVENDGLAFSDAGENSGLGHGLANMRRRATGLQGEVTIDALAHGTRLTLLLPRRFPAFDDEA